MKKIYTWSGVFSQRNLTISDIIKNKGQTKYIQTTATNKEEASAAKEAGFDMILCKSSNIKAVREGAPDIFLTATIDLVKFPLRDDVLREAFDALSSGADQIYTARGPHIVEYLSKENIPVMCHLGLVPRKSTWKGGLRVVGKKCEEAIQLLKEFKTMESAGATSAECEIIASNVMSEIYKKTNMIISSLGSGPSGDIIYLFQNDICGEQEHIPRHAKTFGNLLKLKEELYNERVLSLKKYKEAVLNNSFPTKETLTLMNNDEFINFKSKI